MDNKPTSMPPRATEGEASTSSRQSGPPICVTVASAMFMLGLGKTKLYELLGDGELEAIRVGRRTLVLRASIDALVERHRSNRN